MLSTGKEIPVHLTQEHFEGTYTDVNALTNHT